MFNFLKGGKVNLNVAIDRASGIYFPGDTVNTRISLSSDKEFKFQEGRVALLYQEKYQYRTIHHRTDSQGHHHTEDVLRWQTNDQELARHVFLRETTLSQGSAQDFEFAAQIPVSAPPTYPGNIIQVRWLVKATLDRKLINDINVETPLVVLASPTGTQTPGQFGLSNEPGEARLILELPGTEWVAGETIEGILLVSPQKNFDATEVRVELEQTEWVPYDRGNQKVSVIELKLAGKTKFSAGETLRFPFQIQIPQPCSPSGSSQNWSVTWKLKGILARLLRKDTAVEQEIKVFTGRPT
jgi:sporulation-control protein spo0M